MDSEKSLKVGRKGILNLIFCLPLIAGKLPLQERSG